MVFDVTDKATFEHVKTWLSETGKHADPKCNRLLVGNKCDMADARVVEHDVAQVRMCTKSCSDGHLHGFVHQSTVRTTLGLC